jgi:hypothetical protein
MTIEKRVWQNCQTRFLVPDEPFPTGPLSNAVHFSSIGDNSHGRALRSATTAARSRAGSLPAAGNRPFDQ